LSDGDDDSSREHDSDKEPYNEPCVIDAPCHMGTGLKATYRGIHHGLIGYGR